MGSEANGYLQVLRPPLPLHLFEQHWSLAVQEEPAGKHSPPPSQLALG